MIKIPGILSGKQLHEFLIKNKAAIIAQKCAFPIKSEPRELPCSIVGKSKASSKKAAGDTMVEIDDMGELAIVAVANSANWIDSQMDMLLADCWKKTIKESGPAGKNRIYHLKNHCQDTDGVVGKITSLYSKDVALSDLGLDLPGSTQCLIMESTVKEAYDDGTFDKYTDKIINQHSIGMQYVKMDVAVNDPNYPAEFAVWNKYFQYVLNKDVAMQCGYFWVVYEIKLLEVSAVLWGSNELTPTMDNEDDDMSDDSYNTGKSSKDTGNKGAGGATHKKTVLEMIQNADKIINL